MNTLLKVRNLRVSFPLGSGWGINKQFIDGVADVSFDIKPGETYAVVGESGSGKTSMLRAIAGLLPASDGSILFEGNELVGRSVADYRPLRKDIAVIFQDPIGSLSPRRTVHALLAEPFIIHSIKVDNLHAETQRLLGLVGLAPEFADRYPHQLSGGQARRVGVARALALSPKLILADEPTAGLDVSVQGELLNLLSELRAKLGLAVLLITHNLNVVRHIANRIGIMYLGRLVEAGETQAVLANPRHPYTLCLLSANPTIKVDNRHPRITLQGEPPSITRRPSGCEFRQRCPFADASLCTQTPQWELDHEHRGVRCLKPLTTESTATAGVDIPG